MDVIEKVLSLRPTNAAQRLGPASRLPVLNPRDVSRALRNRPLACLWVPALGALPGVLRAARELDAVVGLASPYAPLDRDGPYRFVDALRAAAAEVSHERPVFLQAGPIRLLGADARSLEQAGEAVFRCLDAGFSLLSLDGSRLPLEEHQHACRELSLPVMERELPVEVTAPRSPEGRTSPELLADFLSYLSQVNVRPRYVRVEARPLLRDADGSDGRWLDADLMAALMSVGTAFKVDLTLEDAGLGALNALSRWGAMGVRKIDATDALGRVWAKALPEDLQASLIQKAAVARLPLAEVLAQSDQFFRGIPQQAQDRAEAICFAETLDLLEGTGAPGTGSGCMSFLAEHSGY